MTVSQPDEVLVEMAKIQAEAFGELYERHLSRIYNYIYYRTGNQADAEDLAEKVFLQALSHLPKYENRGIPFAVWLFRIAHNLVANWHRDRKRRAVLSLDSVADLHNHDNHIERLEDLELLRATVGRLPKERQELIILKFVQDFSNTEIAKIMGRTEGAIKALIHRTVKTLREDIRAKRKEVQGL